MLHHGGSLTEQALGAAKNIAKLTGEGDAPGWDIPVMQYLPTTAISGLGLGFRGWNFLDLAGVAALLLSRWKPHSKPQLRQQWVKQRPLGHVTTPGGTSMASGSSTCCAPVLCSAPGLVTAIETSFQLRSTTPGNAGNMLWSQDRARPAPFTLTVKNWYYQWQPEAKQL